MDDVIIRNDKARKISSMLCQDVLDAYKATELTEWHSYRLLNLYISDRHNTEISIQLNRGFKSDVNIDIDIVPDESIDRLSDRLIDTVKINLKKYVIQDDDLDIEFDDDEYISGVNISTAVNRNRDSYSESSYTISFDTDVRDSKIISDYKVHNNPRINGKRILVSDIYRRYERLDDFEGLEAIRQDMDNLVTIDEIKEAVEFAKDSDKIESKSDTDFEPSDSKDLDDIVQNKEELKTLEDNR